jgi:DNA-binding transcriptional MerR regulator
MSSQAYDWSLRAVTPKTIDNIVRVGALRSRLVSKLTGLTKPQLQYWHGTELLPAHQRRGARGYPRLYSWVDYMKLREASKLLQAGVSTRVIRRTVPILEELDAEWYLLPLEAYAPRHRQIAARLKDGVAMLADRSGQLLLSSDTLEHTLVQIEREGPLGELHDFRDAVAMDPSVLAGNPVVVGSRIETDFLAGLTTMGYGSPDIASLYRLPLHHVDRALEFELKVAA